jgi:rubredoxin
MGKFKCRVCGHTEYINNYIHYQCKNCSVVFRNIEQFNLKDEEEIKNNNKEKKIESN